MLLEPFSLNSQVQKPFMGQKSFCAGAGSPPSSGTVFAVVAFSAVSAADFDAFAALPQFGPFL